MLVSARRGTRVAAAAVSRSLDHPIGAQQERLRNRQPQRLRGLEVEHQLKLVGLLEWKIGGLHPLEQSVDVERPPAADGRVARSIRQEPPGLGHLPRLEQGRQAGLQRKSSDLVTILKHERVAGYEQRIRTLLRDRREPGREVVGTLDLVGAEGESQSARR